MLGEAFHCHNWHMRYLPLLLLLVLPVQAHLLLDDEPLFPATAETVHQGKVVKIADGDTLTLLVDSKQHKIRLSDIDTPERKQPFGTRAKQALSELAFGKQARVVEVTVDRYGESWAGSMSMAWTLTQSWYGADMPGSIGNTQTTLRCWSSRLERSRKGWGCGLILIRFRHGSGGVGGGNSVVVAQARLSKQRQISSSSNDQNRPLTDIRYLRSGLSPRPQPMPRRLFVTFTWPLGCLGSIHFAR